MKYKRALFIGRFQPLHNGHLHVIQRILQESEEIIIAVGSAQESYTLRNPLTVGERIEIIRDVLKMLKAIERAYIIPIPDINENAVWPARVMEYCPKFDCVYSGNELVLMLFERFGIKTVRIQHIKRELYQGKVIMERILRGLDYRDLVPEIVYRKLKQFGFEERIKRLMGMQNEQNKNKVN